MRERSRRIFSWVAFPVGFCGSVALTLALMDLGVPPALAFTPGIVLSYAGVALLERVFPYQRSWQRSRGDLRVDFGHLVVSGLFTLEALRPLALVASVAVGGWLSARLGTGLWPDHWPILGQLAAALVLGEFFMYWIHRLTHEVELLWRFHATHHSAPRLYWLNAARFHPVDLALSYFCWWMPLVALGAPEPVLALYGLVSGVHGVFQHANLELRLGPLNWIFSMAELHRWHHAPTLRESNTNYGQNLIVWDVVFGTRYLPADREPPAEIGLSHPTAFPMTYWAQLVSPLRWARIEAESGARGETSAETQEV